MIVKMELEFLITVVDADMGERENEREGYQTYHNCSKLLCVNASNPKISRTAMKTPLSSALYTI
jgi:hypothetical protein